MRFTKTLSYEHQAKKNRKGERDITEKFHVIDILKKHFSLHGITGEVVYCRDSKIRLPDIFVRDHYPMLAIELDGEIHGNGDVVSQLQKDKQRKKDYASANNIKLIVINKQVTNGYDTDMVISEFVNQGLIL